MKMKFLSAFVIMTVIFAFSVCAEVEHDGYILKFKYENAKEEAMMYLEKSGFLLGEEISVSEVYEPDNLYKTDSEEIAKIFEKLGFLEYYEPDAICYLFDYDYSLDSYYNSHQSTWAHACSNAPGAWKYGVYGNDVKVAVIDSGVLATHEDLVGSVTDGYTLVTDSPATSPVISHGTGVAGVIASGANGKGVVGTAHRAKIVPIKVTDQSSFDASVLYEAVNKAIELDVDVINLSLGTLKDLDSLKEAIDKAIAGGIIVVAASGNNYAAGTAMYPASYDNVISVGNLKKSGSNFVIYSGSVANDQVTVSAPGTSVYTTLSDSASSYGRYTGTSFASPYVAGIAALAKSIDPEITQSEFMDILIKTAKKSVLNGAERTDAYGYGIADAGAVVKELIARRQKGGFISPIDKTVSNGINVKVCNPLGTQQSFSFISKVYSVDRPISFAFKSLTLDPDEVVEIPLASLAGADSSNISCYLLDPLNLRPLYNKIDR